MTEQDRSTKATCAIENLHAICGKTLAETLAPDRQAQLATLYLFSLELESWISVLESRPEIPLLEIAQQEYVISLLNVAQGQYRNSFKGLRLTFELGLQAVLLSTDLIGLREWLSGESDTRWAAITDPDNGVFSNRFRNAFFPELSETRGNFGTMAKDLYRELSECIHGNVPNAIPLPSSLKFNQPAYEMWSEKAITLQLILHYALALRYLKELDTSERDRLTKFLLDYIGHMSPIRTLLGGVAT